MKYPNIKAEQARKGLTNQQVADHLGICRNTYEAKLRRGYFYVEEAQELMELFGSDFDYLFAKSV